MSPIFHPWGRFGAGWRRPGAFGISRYFPRPGPVRGGAVKLDVSLMVGQIKRPHSRGMTLSGWQADRHGPDGGPSMPAHSHTGFGHLSTASAEETCLALPSVTYGSCMGVVSAAGRLYRHRRSISRPTPSSSLRERSQIARLASLMPPADRVHTPPTLLDHAASHKIGVAGAPLPPGSPACAVLSATGDDSAAAGYAIRRLPGVTGKVRPPLVRPIQHALLGGPLLQPQCGASTQLPAFPPATQQSASQTSLVHRTRPV